MKPAETNDTRGEGTAQTALAWSVSAGKADDVLHHMEASIRRRRRLRQRAFGATAALVLTLGLGFFWRATLRDDIAARARVGPATAVVHRPERKALPDGSVVELNQGARITVDFSSEWRRVVLGSGEAHFQVSKDPRRPFVVSARGVEVRAVGTAFVVELGASAIDVVVTEGIVTVAPSSPATASLEPAASIAVLEAGTRISVDASAAPAATPPVVIPMDARSLNERLAWRVPRLELNGTPLADAIAMFNEHGRLNLVLGPSLGHLQISGALRADSVDALLTMLKNEFGIQSERRGDTGIFLYRP